MTDLELENIVCKKHTRLEWQEIFPDGTEEGSFWINHTRDGSISLYSSGSYCEYNIIGEEDIGEILTNIRNERFVNFIGELFLKYQQGKGKLKNSTRGDILNCCGCYDF